jgi:hypothetical protein
MINDQTLAAWRKSTRSQAATNCVEVADLSDGACAVRDSKNPDGVVLRIAGTQWTAFTAGVRSGDFD